jgi:transposase
VGAIQPRRGHTKHAMCINLMNLRNSYFAKLWPPRRRRHFCFAVRTGTLILLKRLGSGAASVLEEDESMYDRYPVEQLELAVKMVLDHLDEYRSVYAACQAIGPKVGVKAESLCRWTLQAQFAASKRPGATTEQQQIKDLEREVEDLRDAVAI